MTTPGIVRFHEKLFKAVNAATLDDESPNEIFMGLVSCAIVVAFKAGASVESIERDWGVAIKKATQLMKE